MQLRALLKPEKHVYSYLYLGCCTIGVFEWQETEIITGNTLPVEKSLELISGDRLFVVICHKTNL